MSTARVQRSLPRAIATANAADITRDETAHFDTPLPDRRTPSPSTPSRTTPAQPLQIKLSGDRAPITVPIDPTDPNRPGTIVIQSPPPQNNTLLVAFVGVVALIAVAAAHHRPDGWQ